MLYTYINTVPAPCAFITVKKQRLRQDGSQVYMKDQTEFEIELYNPTKNKVLATIEMNGQSISSSGIILKPGQRVFLERFLDSDKKFLYETYQVNNNDVVKEAIQDNGKVTVKFHKESNTPVYRGYQYGSVFTTPNSFNWSEITYTNNINNNVIRSNNINDIKTFFTNSANVVSDRKIETGMVEEGSKSDQELKSTNGKFDWYYTWIDEWQIMPYSQQPKTTKDLVEKCVKCTAKLKSNYKFCPECGNEVPTKATEKETMEAYLSTLSNEELIKMLMNKQ